MFCSFAPAASSIPCGNRQVREENSKLLLTSLETLRGPATKKRPMISG